MDVFSDTAKHTGCIEDCNPLDLILKSTEEKRSNYFGNKNLSVDFIETYNNK